MIYHKCDLMKTKHTSITTFKFQVIRMTTAHNNDTDNSSDNDNSNDENDNGVACVHSPDSSRGSCRSLHWCPGSRSPRCCLSHCSIVDGSWAWFIIMMWIGNVPNKFIENSWSLHYKTNNSAAVIECDQFVCSSDGDIHSLLGFVSWIECTHTCHTAHAPRNWWPLMVTVTYQYFLNKGNKDGYIAILMNKWQQNTSHSNRTIQSNHPCRIVFENQASLSCTAPIWFHHSL